MTIVGILVLCLALALTVIGSLSWAERLPGNSYIGIRVPEVRKSQELWNIAHKMAGPLWVAGGIAAFLAGLLCFTESGWLWILAVALLVATLVLVSLGASAGARAVSILAAEEHSNDSCCSSGDAAPAEPAPAPQVDIAALRRAAKES